MAPSTSTERLAVDICEVLGDVLVHQRVRWGALLCHQRQFEGWWKAEFALALENWAWSFRSLLPSRTFGVVEEAKPRWIAAGEGGQAADLLVAPWSDQEGKLDCDGSPRVWIEIKERADWWGAPAKALGQANGGLWKDLRKWDGVFTPELHAETDVVLACQVLNYRAGWEPLPQNWSDAYQEVVNQGFSRLVDPCSVGYELPSSRRKKDEPEFQYLWARLDVFKVFPRQA